jgi:hypothetical protein
MKRKPQIRFSCRKIIVNRKTSKLIFYGNKIASSKFEGLQTTPQKGGAQNCCGPMDKARTKSRSEPEELTG